MRPANALTASDLPGLLRPGMSVYLPGSSGEPTLALQSLAREPQCTSGVHFITSFVPGINRFDLSSLGEGATFTTFFMHPSLQQSASEGRVNCLELSYSRIADWLAVHPVDLAVVQVSAETRGGHASLGPAVEFTPIVLRHARLKVAVQNQQTPWLAGAVAFPLTDFDWLVGADTPLPTYRDPVLDDTYRRIGEHVASLIPSGASLQTGLGQAPAAVLAALGQHRDLALHTGVFSDSTLRLIESGAMPRHNPLVSGVAVGSEDFYRQLVQFPQIRFAPVNETHDARNLAAIPRLFTINSAIEVDQQGNLNAEFLHGKRISGRGGLPDFAAAGHASENGGSIIVLPSTDAKGSASRIVRQLQSLASVPGEWVDYVVTEHGCAHLKGRSPEARATALAAITAPQWRENLHD